MHHIIAFVGPSGAGKTAIIKRLVKELPNRFGPLPGFITRPLREGEEQLNLTVVSPAIGRCRYQAFTHGNDSRYVNVSEHAGIYYGNERAVVDQFLTDRVALKDLVPDGVLNFRRAGYRVDVIVVEPTGHTPRPGREVADREIERHFAELSPIFHVHTDHHDKFGLDKAIIAVMSGLNEKSPTSIP